MIKNKLIETFNIESVTENDIEKCAISLGLDVGKDISISGGPMFILSNGNFIDAYREDKGYYMHSDFISDVLSEIVGKNSTYEDGDSLLEYIEELGVITVNAGSSWDRRCKVVIDGNVTNNQYESLLKWLDLANIDFGRSSVIIYCHDECVVYNFDEYSSDDIIKKIKRYFTSGKLYEDYDEDDYDDISRKFIDYVFTEDMFKEYAIKHNILLNEPTSSSAGPMFITSDGKCIDVMAGDFDIHSQYISKVFREYEDIDYEDYDDYIFDEIILYKFGVITVNAGASFDDRCKIVCFKKPTYEQQETLLKWLDKASTDYNRKSVIVFCSNNDYVNYYFNEYSSDDILKRIINYFSSGKLREQKYDYPNKQYNIKDKKALWNTKSQDYNWWGSEADKWAPDYAKSYKVTMSPKDFLKLTIKGNVDELKVGNRIGISPARKLDKDEFDKEWFQPLFLQIEFTKDNQVAKVVGHEGRHRAFALMNEGISQIDVELRTSEGDRNFDKYNPHKLDKLTLIGQFNSSVKVDVDSPLPMSLNTHKEINPNLRESLSKYDDKEELLRECGKEVYHVTYEHELENIKKEDLHDFWFGLDLEDCVNMVEYNHDEYENEIVIVIPTKLLDYNKCDFTVDSGDGWSDDWVGTGLYKGIIDINKCKIYDLEE